MRHNHIQNTLKEFSACLRGLPDVEVQITRYKTSSGGLEVRTSAGVVSYSCGPAEASFIIGFLEAGRSCPEFKTRLDPRTSNLFLVKREGAQ